MFIFDNSLNGSYVLNIIKNKHGILIFNIEHFWHNVSMLNIPISMRVFYVAS